MPGGTQSFPDDRDRVTAARAPGLARMAARTTMLPLIATPMRPVLPMIGLKPSG